MLEFLPLDELEKFASEGIEQNVGNMREGIKSNEIFEVTPTFIGDLAFLSQHSADYDFFFCALTNLRKHFGPPVRLEFRDPPVVVGKQLTLPV